MSICLQRPLGLLRCFVTVGTHGHVHFAANGSLTRYVKWRVAHAPEMPGTFSPPPRVSDPDMHRGTCVTHVRDACRDWKLALSLEVCGGENVPGIPGACATRNFTHLARGPFKWRGRVTHICVSKLGHHWFRTGLVAWWAPNHFRNQCWIIIN